MSTVRSQVKRALDAKQRAGGLPPQQCPSCEADLSDTGVPTEYREYARMFTLAVEIKMHDGWVWRCPWCLHMWGKHQNTEP